MFKKSKKKVYLEFSVGKIDVVLIGSLSNRLCPVRELLNYTFDPAVHGKVEIQLGSNNHQ